MAVSFSVEMFLDPLFLLFILHEALFVLLGSSTAQVVDFPFLHTNSRFLCISFSKSAYGLPYFHPVLIEVEAEGAYILTILLKNIIIIT
jgi:hypothetical protein